MENVNKCCYDAWTLKKLVLRWYLPQLVLLPVRRLFIYWPVPARKRFVAPTGSERRSSPQPGAMDPGQVHQPLRGVLARL